MNSREGNLRFPHSMASLNLLLNLQYICLINGYMGFLTFKRKVLIFFAQ